MPIPIIIALLIFIVIEEVFN